MITGLRTQPYVFISKPKTEPTQQNQSTCGNSQPLKESQLRLSGYKPYTHALVSFGYDFMLKSVEGLPCPCCGITMSTNDEIRSFTNKMVNARGQRIIENIEKYEDRLPEVERSVTNRLKIAAEEYQNLDLHGLLKKIQNEPRKELERKQKEILNEMQELSKELNGNTYNVIKKDIDQINKIILEGKNGKPFKRKTLIQGMEKVRNNETDPQNRFILNKIVEKTMDMPTSSTDANAFIVKYSRRTTPEIARRLIEPSQATAEHIKPHSKNGHDGAENYLSECKKCNNDRGNMTYVEWLKIHPEMIKNSQIYMDAVTSKIIDGSITAFNFYPNAVKRAIFEESEGMINLDLSKFNEYKKNIVKDRAIHPQGNPDKIYTSA